jgi:hypothetical protein
VSQTTQRCISEKVKSLRESDVLPFHDILDARMVKAALDAEGATFNESIYTPLITVCVFLSQVLDPDHSCRAAVSRLIVWLALIGRKPCSADTGAYCDARQRLALGVVIRLTRQTAREIDERAPQKWLWKGRRVTLVDGSTASMPDTVENQRAFPQSKAQGIGLGFPLVRFVLRDRGAERARRGRAVPNAPAAEVRLPPRSAARRRGPHRDLDQASSARLDGQGDL